VERKCKTNPQFQELIQNPWMSTMLTEVKRRTSLRLLIITAEKPAIIKMNAEQRRKIRYRYPKIR
jgi:hypothetical protein